MHPVSAASVKAELREDHLALVMSTKKLCDELKKNQKYQINVRDNAHNDDNCSSFINESLLERMEKLERIALNLVKCVEFQSDIIWGPAPAVSVATVRESAVGRKNEDTVDVNRSDLATKEKPKLMLLKPVADVRAISRDVGSALQATVGVGVDESREIDTLSPSDSQLNQAKPRIALQQSEFTLLGANISQKFHQANPSYRNQLIEHCQGEFVKLIASVGKGSDHEIHAAKFLGFLAQLYIHIGNKASSRIKIFPVAIVELLRTLLGVQGSDLLKENLVCARELLQLMKPTLMEEPDPSLFEEVTKLKAQCDKLKANGCMNAELKRHLLATNSDFAY
ncbi:unnamed protein product [Allacma fusca]|uniref:Uncharacterized protein n=1 Tax=Allacma fusca TaxID=39272 RepID=A0A8J2J308_9HEXA|nr:unnamed protein product [Allacma fusca]